MQSQKFHENVKWNFKETFFNLHINYMAAFDWIKLLGLKNTLDSVRVLSSPNSPLLFVIVFWGKTNISSLLQMFFKIGVLKIFGNFIGKHQCWSLFLIKMQIWRPEMLLKIDSIRTNPVDLCGSLCGKVMLWSFSASLF